MAHFLFALFWCVYNYEGYCYIIVWLRCGGSCRPTQAIDNCRCIFGVACVVNRTICLMWQGVGVVQGLDWLKDICWLCDLRTFALWHCRNLELYLVKYVCIFLCLKLWLVIYQSDFYHHYHCRYTIVSIFIVIVVYHCSYIIITAFIWASPSHPHHIWFYHCIRQFRK